MTDYKGKFEKLNNANYMNWKFKIELLLKKEELWSALNKPRPEDLPAAATNDEKAARGKLQEEWDRLDERVFSWIGLSIEDDQIVHVRNENTALGAWNKLKSYHEKATLSNKVHLMRMICTLKMEENGRVPDHINEMRNLFIKLKDISNDELSEPWSVAMLLSSLPKGYDTLIIALEARDEKDLTFSFVQQKLIAEYERRGHAAGESFSSETLLKVTEKGKINKMQCFFCKKPNHMKKDCAEYKKWLAKKQAQGSKDKVNSVNSDNNDFVFAVNGKVRDGWLLDSGATRHVTNSREFFGSLDETYKANIEVGNGEKVNVVGIGNGKVQFLNRAGKVQEATAKDVLYAPELVGNVLSIGKLAENGFEIIFKDNYCEIDKNNEQVAVVDRKNNLYQLRTPERVNILSLEHNENCIHSWHRRLGHRDPAAIRRMAAKELVGGIKIKECGFKELCETCTKGKMTRKPFPKEPSNRRKAVLDLVHTDVCGPMQTETMSGKRYIVTFTDDFSRFTVVKLLAHKSEVEKSFREFVEMTKTTFGKKPKILRSDRGGEYTGKQFKEYLKEEGITAQLTASYSPEQNGVAERKNRSIMEMARCMLIDSGLPNSFWGEAVSTAVFIHNRVITRSTGEIPYEQWSGSKVLFDNMHSFGSKCFVHIPKEKRRKLDHTGKEMVFLGYDNQSKAFRCYNPVTRKVEISRDVTFPGEVGLSTEFEIDFQSQKKKGTKEERKEPEVENIPDNEIEEEEIEEEDIQVEQVQIPQRITSRSTKGKPPPRLIEEINLTIEEPKDYEEAMSSKDRNKWIIAMQEEMESLKKNSTWELTDLPEKREAIGCKWVFKVKKNEKGVVQRYKARLVAQGFSQKFGVDFNEVFAPVGRQSTFRTLLSVAGRRKMKVHHLDAKTAFLNGSLEEVIYMNQPPGFNFEDQRKVCLLKKSIYGLKQAARTWYEKVNEALIDGGFTQGKADPCLYTKKIGNDWCYVLIYVDDVLVVCRTRDQVEAIRKLLASKFEIMDLGEIKHYLGIEVTRDEHGNFELRQSEYIDQVAKMFGLEEAKEAKTPMEIGYYKSPSETSRKLVNNKDYQKLLGCLLYISINTRPDITASVNILAQKTSSPSQEDWEQLKRVVRYLKGTSELKLKLSDNGGVNGEELFGYSDANWAEDKETRKSNSGYVFFLNGGVISWSCRKQTCVSLSSTEAEFIALSDTCQETIWLRRLLVDMHEAMKNPTLIYEDNQSCLKIIKEEKFSNRTKHIDTRFHFVKDHVEKGHIHCKFCPTEIMIADILTKPLPRIRHVALREKCKVI